MFAWSPKNCLKILIFISLSMVTSCGEKAVMQAEINQINASLEEHRNQVRELNAQSAAVGNLGEYQNPKAEQLQILRAKIEQLKVETKNLEASKAAEIIQFERSKSQLSAYRRRYLE